MRIAVFDSGVGGITVLKELISACPNDEFIYLGDTANVPYGTKSKKRIQELTSLSVKKLKKMKIDLLVVACNTASALAIQTARKEMGKTPVIGMIESGVSSIRETLETVHQDSMDLPVLILGTRATIKSEVYKKSLLQNIETKIQIHEQACPLLVPLIEEGWVNHAAAELILSEYVAHYRSQSAQGIALLACTHYPWIQKKFEKLLPGWIVLNSAITVAKYINQHHNEAKRNKPRAKAKNRIHWFFTDPDVIPKFILEEINQLSGNPNKIRIKRV